MTGTPLEREGVVRYEARHREMPLDPALAPWAEALAAWRHPLRGLGWLGREEGRYGGYGFGNLSARVPPGLAGLPGNARDGEATGETANPFLITGSQTGGQERLGLAGFALVERHDVAANRLWSRGSVAASSEALTHAALYAASPGIGAVFHVHAPDLWRHRRSLGLEETPDSVPYGTPGMAREVVAARRRSAAAREGAGSAGVMAMAGHEDGLLAWGPDPAAAGRALLAVAGWW